MNAPQIRTLPDAVRAIGQLWQSVFMGDTIVRYRTTAFAVLSSARATSGDMLTVIDGVLQAAVAGSTDREPTYNVTIPSPRSLVVAGHYTVAANNTLTIAASGELRVL